MRRLLFVLVAFLLVHDAGAQIIRPGMRLGEPSAWVSFGTGLQNNFDVVDGTTGSAWQFGDATQFYASIEKNLSGGASLGVRGTRARAPLFYSGTTSGDADADVSQVMATLHVASGRGFHSVLELSAGATIYSNFRSRVTDQRLEPRSPDTDFAFAFAYGFGYNVSPAFTIDAVQDQSTSLHQKTGLSASQSSTSRFTTTRIVARIGLGGR